jgi:hypothetical protein
MAVVLQSRRDMIIDGGGFAKTPSIHHVMQIERGRIYI